MSKHTLTAAAKRLNTQFDGSGERGLDWLADRGLALDDFRLYLRTVLPGWVSGKVDLMGILTLALTTGYMLGVEDEQTRPTTHFPAHWEGSE